MTYDTTALLQTLGQQRLTETQIRSMAEHPNVVFDADGAAIGINWERVIAERMVSSE